MTWKLRVLPILVLPLLSVTACAKKAPTVAEQLASGMARYLAQRGDLCIGKNAWPIDVSNRDVEQQTRNAVQMPVLEHLGLARSTEIQVEVIEGEEKVLAPVTRYQLTEAGKRYYIARDTNAVTASGEHVRESDFCVAKLSLDEVVGWELASGDQSQAVVTYTYHVEAPDWTRTAEARRAFPAVDRVILGDGTARLTEGFTRTETGWVANDLVRAPSLVAQRSLH